MKNLTLGNEWSARFVRSDPVRSLPWPRSPQGFQTPPSSAISAGSASENLGHLCAGMAPFDGHSLQSGPSAFGQFPTPPLSYNAHGRAGSL